MYNFSNQALETMKPLFIRRAAEHSVLEVYQDNAPGKEGHYAQANSVKAAGALSFQRYN